MNEIKSLDKMKRVTFVLTKVLSVVTWLLVACVVLLSIGGLIILLMDDKYFTIKDAYKGNISLVIEGWFKYNIVGEPGNVLSFKPLVLTIIPTVIVSVVFYIINVKLIKNILKYLLEGKPFDLRSSKSLWMMSINFFVASIVFKIAGSLIALKMMDMLNVETSNIGLLPDVSLVFTGLLLMILSGVFRYGYYLQEAYDETV